MTNHDSTRRNQGVAEHYLVGCPDVLEIRIADRPELSGRFAVNASGRIELGDYGALRVEGRPLAEIANLLAGETGQRPADVQVRIAEFRSQFVFLCGQVVGWQRTVPYQGQETVLDLLQRVGGITLTAEPGDVYVVRPHIADGQRPEIFHVDLKAIVIKHNEKTNLRLQPFDQVYVGETRQAQVEKSFPPWLRPVYQAFWNMLPDPQRPAASPAPAPQSPWVTAKGP